MRACALRTRGGFLSRSPAALSCRWRRSSRPPCLAGCAPARADNSRARRGAGRHRRRAGCGQRPDRRCRETSSMPCALARCRHPASRARSRPVIVFDAGCDLLEAHRAQLGNHAACLERARELRFRNRQDCSRRNADLVVQRLPASRAPLVRCRIPAVPPEDEQIWIGRPARLLPPMARLQSRKNGDETWRRVAHGMPRSGWQRTIASGP